MTFSGRWLIHRAMVGTYEVARVFRKELVVDPIHRDRNMAAAIDVRVDIPMESDGESLKGLSPAPQQERHSAQRTAHSADRT